MIEVRGVHLNERHPWKVREWSPGTGGIQALAFHKRRSGREEERLSYTGSLKMRC